MRVFHDAWNAVDLPHGTVATIGNFDGVHRGQRAILERLVERAAAVALPAVVVTFDPHPLAVLRPGEQPPRLTTPEQKRELLAAAGVAALAVVGFDAELAEMPADSFARRFLHRRLGVRELFVGSRFAFGRRREGDLALLERLGRELGFACDGVREIEHDGAPVSSTRIRQALARGEAELARALLGRPYAVRGRQRPGAGRGKELGWPTVNVAVENEIVPADGVYATRVRVGEEGATFDSVTNVGRRPTFESAGERVVESHLFEFESRLSGARLETFFFHRLRAERRFESVDELVRQIGRDAQAAREYLTSVSCLDQQARVEG